MAVMLAIFGTSSLEDVSHLPVDVPDKLAHVLAYAALGACLLWGVADRRLVRVTAGRSFAAWGAAAIYGVSDEWHQSFVPGRTMAFDDWLADAVGAAVAIAVVLVARRRPPGHTL